MARLGDVCTVSSSNAPISDNRIWLLNLDMVEQQTGNIISYNYVGNDDLNGSIIQFNTDNVLYSKLRPNLNKVVIPDRGGFSTSEMLPLKPNASVLCREYLAAYLRSDSFVSWAVSKTAGAKMPRLGTKVLLDKEIPLPSLEEQRRIAATLDKVSDLIAKRRAQLDKLDLLVKSRFVEMFGDPNLTNQIWDMSIFGNEFSVTSGGTPSTTEPTYWEEGTIPWIGSNMCQDTILYGNDGKFITKSGLEHSSAKVFPSGTVLVALVGATIGKTALLRFNTATNQNVAAIDVLSNKRFYPEFIFYELQMLYEKFQELGSGKFKMANQGFVRGLPTICPPLELQKEFAVLVELIQKSKLTVQQSLDKLEILKKALMQQYFGVLQ